MCTQVTYEALQKIAEYERNCGKSGHEYSMSDTRMQGARTFCSTQVIHMLDTIVTRRRTNLLLLCPMGKSVKSITLTDFAVPDLHGSLLRPCSIEDVEVGSIKLEVRQHPLLQASDTILQFWFCFCCHLDGMARLMTCFSSRSEPRAGTALIGQSGNDATPAGKKIKKTKKTKKP